LNVRFFFDNKLYMYAYVICDVSKFTIDGIKLSLINTERIAFQSTAFTFNSKHTDSNANLTAGGGFAIDLTSARCFFLIELTAI